MHMARRQDDEPLIIHMARRQDDEPLIIHMARWQDDEPLIIHMARWQDARRISGVHGVGVAGGEREGRAWPPDQHQHGAPAWSVRWWHAYCARDTACGSGPCAYVTVIGFDGSARAPLDEWFPMARGAAPRMKRLVQIIRKRAITKVFGYLATYYANLQITHRPIRIAAWSSAEHRFCYTPLPPLTAAPQTRSTVVGPHFRSPSC